MSVSFCVDRRVARYPRYYFGDGSPLMFVPEVIRECVAFVGLHSKKYNGNFKLGGTAALIRMELAGDSLMAYYAVTARHVIEKIKSNSTDDKAILRVNVKNAEAKQIETNCSDWVFHPTDSSVDVAALQLKHLPDDLDHKFLSVASFIHPEELNYARIGIGEEVFLAGLFVSHSGTKKNIPIIRVGNIAAMPHERIKTQSGDIEGYLVETRSIGGLSGSPVFVLTIEPNPLEVVRKQGTLNITKPTGESATFEVDAGEFLSAEKRMLPRPYSLESFCLFGLMHGHFNLPKSAQDGVVEDAEGDHINTGIGIVIPAAKIWEVLQDSKLESERQAMIAEFMKELTAEPDMPPDDLRSLR